LISWWALLLLSLGYVSILFAIAYWGDITDPRKFSGRARAAIYGLTLAVYCTSWTFYGAVGSAVENGWGYLPIYIGPMLVILFGWGMIHRIVKVSKRQNLTSIADFIAARYGKARSLAVLVTVIATIGSVPYIALQLKAVVAGFDIVSNYSAAGGGHIDTAFVFAAALAIFAILFGTRKIDVTEHHDGMMLAVAFESVVKLFAFIAVGMFAWLLLGNVQAVTPEAAERAAAAFRLDRVPDTFMTQLILASAAIFCLPRQFHVAVVEAYEDANIQPTRWTFPLYLLVFCIFVVPITIAGLKFLPVGEFSGDAFVLALPIQGEQTLLTVLAFLGGFSAATSMVIVASVALSTMISNEIVMPALLSIKMLGLADRKDYTNIVLNVRRGAIIGIAALAYLYVLAIDRSAALASIGLLSFAAAAQFMPLIVFGLYWPGSTRTGAIAGLSTGFVLWAYTLFLPTLARSGAFSDAFITEGLFGQAWLRPEALLVDLQTNTLTHGVAWSLGANILINIAVSMISRQSVVEKIQARTFAGPTAGFGPARVATGRHDITNADLRSLAESFLGHQNVERSFADFSASTRVDLGSSGPADRRLLQFTERLIAGAIGASSARVVMTAALRKTGTEIGDVVLLLDETSQALTFNRRLLDATLENITQGVSVVDSAQRLIGWNSRYEELMKYPPGMVHVGESVADLIRFNGEQGRFGDADVDSEVKKRIRHMKTGTPYRFQSTFIDGKVIEISGQPMPGGGYVTTYHGIQAVRERTGRGKGIAGAARRRPDRRTGANDVGTPAGQGGSRGRQRIEDALPRSRRSRPAATAQCREIVCRPAERAPRRPAAGAKRAGRARREQPRRRRRPARRTAGHLSPRYRRAGTQAGGTPGFGNLHGRRDAVLGRVRGKGTETQDCEVVAVCPIGPGAAAAHRAKLHQQRATLYGKRRRIARLPAARRQRRHPGRRHRYRHRARGSASRIRRIQAPRQAHQGCETRVGPGPRNR
jgi:Na+/proline symporter